MSNKKVLELCMDVRYGKSSVEGVTPVERKLELVEIFSELMKNYDTNKTEINAIMTENIDAVVNLKLQDALSIFADISNVPHGTQKKYKVRNGKITAEYVALGSEIRRQKIYNKEVKSETRAVGNAVYVEWDDILSGRAEAFTEMIDEMADSILETILADVQASFTAAMAKAPSANKYSGAFSLAQLRAVSNTVGAYGKPVIVGTSVALSNITADSGFQANMSDGMKEAFNRDGFIGVWEGKALVQLPNAFTDENNIEWVLDNNLIFVVPVNADKPVKVTLEGVTNMLEDQSFKDGSITRKALQKAGVNVLQVHNLGMYTIV